MSHQKASFFKRLFAYIILIEYHIIYLFLITNLKALYIVTDIFIFINAFERLNQRDYIVCGKEFTQRQRKHH